MRTTFFPALWGVCCGTRIFPALCKNSGARAVWHLFVMSILCAVLITVGGAGRATKEWRECVKRFDTAFGSLISLSAQGIRPEKTPAEPRFISLPGDGGLLYTAGETEAKFPAGFTSEAVYFTVWSDFCIAVGVRIAEADWQIRVVNPDQSFTVHKVGRDGLSAFLGTELVRLRAAGGAWKLPQFKIGTGELFRLFKHLITAVVFISELLGIFVLGVFCTVFFAVISRLTGAAALRGLDGWEYWKVGVYAGFPGMLVGGVAEALDLPYLAYGVVYSLALVIYWLPASLACAESADGTDGDPRA